MAEYLFTKVYAAADINWSASGSPANGVPVNSTFTVTGAGGEMTVEDDDNILEDNTNAGQQTRDTSQQTLVDDFGQNSAGDYVWSRAYQEVTDGLGNTGRIYQIRIGTYSGSGLPDSNSTNVHSYYAFSGNLVVMPGMTYTVTSTFNGLGNQPYPAFSAPVCFTADSLILTENGPVAAADLREGDMVMTRDGGPLPLRWIGTRKVTRAEMQAQSNLCPIRIRAGALGEGIPAQDLTVSQQHRILVRSKIAQRMFGAAEILVAAKQLLQLDGVDILTDLDTVTYVHFMFDDHHIVTANGLETESLYIGPQARLNIGEQAFEEICTIFPELRGAAQPPVPARPLAQARRARQLVSRHMANDMAIVSH